MFHQPLPPFNELSKHMEYCPNTGIGIWLVNIGNVKAGTTIQSLDRHGYIRVAYKYKRYKAHRLFWLLHTGLDPGKFSIDHIDNNRLNNKFNNLRLATQAQQVRNRREIPANTSGHRGVYWNKKLKKYVAQIVFNKKLIYLGLYNTIDQAISVRQTKELELFGEFSPLHQSNNDQRLILDNND